MRGYYYTALLMSPAIAAICLSQMAKSRWGGRILLWGGLISMVGLFITILLGAQCDGNWLKGFLNCKLRPLTSYFEVLHRASMLSLISYMIIGPVLVACAALLEWRYHLRNS